MLRSTPLFALAALLVSASAAQAADTKFVFKAGGLAKVTFTSKAPFEDIVGINNQVSGHLALDLSAPASSAKGSVEVKMDGFKTGIDMRDDHFRSDQWLDTTKFPKATFEITKVTGDGQLTFGKKIKGQVHGKMTIHGVTKPVVADVTVGYYKHTPQMKKMWISNHLLVVDGSFKVKVKDFGVKGAPQLFGSKVANEVEIALKLAGEQQ